jgi:putative glutamine amidotransferase
MMKPLVGVTCCNKPFGMFATPNHAASDSYVEAVSAYVNAIPALLPASAVAADPRGLLPRLNGIIFTGSRSNVQPGLYGGTPHSAGVPEDAGRDAATLPLLRAAIAAGVPVLAICRGLQEMNVAFGGTLHQRLQDLPGRIDHSTPLQANPLVRVGKAHVVAVAAGSWLHRISGLRTIPVNSLHNQGIDRLGKDLVVEAVAPDGTIEAIRHCTAPAFAIGVQWHPEHDMRSDVTSQAIFAAFAEAVHDHSSRSYSQYAAD